MSNISKEQILLASKGWIGSLLNFLPGLGAGYLYQRRWIPYFSTLSAFLAWFLIGIILQGGKEPSKTEQLIGLSGILFISIITVIEANLAYKRAANKIKIEQQKITAIPTKKSWFG